MAVGCPYCGHDVDYLTVGQAAAVLGVTKKTIRRRIQRGNLPGTQVVLNVWAPKTYKIPATAILPLVEMNHE